MWVTYDPDYQGTDTLKIMSFILCLAPPCTFWLLPGHRWRSIPCDQELGAVLSETGVFFHTLSLKWMQYILESTDCRVSHLCTNLCVAKPESLSEKWSHRRPDHCEHGTLLGPLYTWKCRDFPLLFLPGRISVFLCQSLVLLCNYFMCSFVLLSLFNVY